MKKYVRDFINEFNNDIQSSGKSPLFEIEHSGDYTIYNIVASDKGLETLYGPLVEWDPYLDLDDHLQALYDLCLQDANK